MMSSTPSILPPPTNTPTFMSTVTTPGEELRDSGGGSGPGDSGVLSPAAVGVVVVSVLLLVLLVVLVTVLMACIFSKKSVKKTFVPANGVQENGEEGKEV